MVCNYQNADCSLRKKILVIYYNFRHTFVPYSRGNWDITALTSVSAVEQQGQNVRWPRAWFSPPQHTHTHTHTRLTALFPWLPGWAGTRNAKPIWISLKQETMSGSGNSWAICKSAPRCRQITVTMPAPHNSVFTGRMPFIYCRPTNSVKALRESFRKLPMRRYRNNRARDTHTWCMHLYTMQML